MTNQTPEAGCLDHSCEALALASSQGASTTIAVEVPADLHPAAALSRAQRFLYPKELSQALTGYGIRELGERACRRLVHEMKRDKFPVQARTQARPIDAAAWLLAHPDWCPFPRRPPSKARGLPLRAR